MHILTYNVTHQKSTYISYTSNNTYTYEIFCFLFFLLSFYLTAEQCKNRKHSPHFVCLRPLPVSVLTDVHDLNRSMLMTASDICAITKPWPVQKQVSISHTHICMHADTPQPHMHASTHIETHTLIHAHTKISFSFSSFRLLNL